MSLDIISGKRSFLNEGKEFFILYNLAHSLFYLSGGEMVDVKPKTLIFYYESCVVSGYVTINITSD